MNKISEAIRSFFNPETAMVSKKETAAAERSAERKPLDNSIYDDLPFVNNGRDKNQEEIFKMISDRYPENEWVPQKTTRHNRRELYKSIHFLRTQSARKWENDIQVQKGEYTKDGLHKNVAATQQPKLKAV